MEEVLSKAIRDLAFQMEEKEKRAAELVIANKELIFQNQEKENRAHELAIANEELSFQNSEKEKRAAELVIANKELIFQNQEKENRAQELVIANEELSFQNGEKEKRAAELVLINKELESFTYISSHDLQEPLRKIQTFSSRLLADESLRLSEKGITYCLRIQDAALRMQSLISDLLVYSRSTLSEREFTTTALLPILEAVILDLQESIVEKKATVVIGTMGDAHIIPFQFRQLMHNLITNALKFSSPERASRIHIDSRISSGTTLGAIHLDSSKAYCHITITDNGIGFEPEYKEYIFELFRRLHDNEKIAGTGIGLTISKKIVNNHNGVITATGEPNKGATFDIYIPTT